MTDLHIIINPNKLTASEEQVKQSGTVNAFVKIDCTCLGHENCMITRSHATIETVK